MDMLWKKENGNADALYVDLFKNIDVTPEYSNVLKFSALVDNFQLAVGKQLIAKSNSTSTDYREKGNEQFKLKNWSSAMRFYNKSLCFAEIGTENVGLAYSNRSACFFHLKMYRKCIVDIDLAIGAKFSERLLPKLENRRECLKAMPQELQQKAPQSDFEEDKNFPGLASVLQIESNKEYGRYFIAKTDIDVAKTILVEKPFISGLILGKKSITCHTCFATGTNLIACEKCTTALFCNSQCMSESYHEISCEKIYSSEDFWFEYATRSILKAIGIFANVDDLIEFVEKIVQDKKKIKAVPSSTIDPKSTYRVFLQLNLYLTDTDKVDFFLRTYEVYDYLMKMPTIKQQFTTEWHKRFLMHLSTKQIVLK